MSKGLRRIRPAPCGAWVLCHPSCIVRDAEGKRPGIECPNRSRKKSAQAVLCRKINILIRQLLPSVRWIVRNVPWCPIAYGLVPGLIPALLQINALVNRSFRWFFEESSGTGWFEPHGAQVRRAWEAAALTMTVLPDGPASCCSCQPHPRSLMQGDYMALDFKVANDAFRGRESREFKDGGMAEALDERGAATFKRLAGHRTPRAANQGLLRYRLRSKEQPELATSARSAGPPAIFPNNARPYS